MMARLFSSRIRELERQNAELAAAAEGRWGDMNLTRMHFENGRFSLECLHKGFAGLLAQWGFNSLKACGAENYVEISVVHPDEGMITIHIQKVKGETPGSKAARLERELAELKAST